MDKMDNKNRKQKSFHFICEKCQYKTANKFDYKKHLGTSKHKMDNEKSQISQETTFICDCGKEYKYKSGLSKHKKKCNFIIDNKINSESIINYNIDVDNNVIFNYIKQNNEIKNILLKENQEIKKENQEIKNTLIKENQELRQQITELIPKVGNNNSTNNTINQKFNINVFLNEKCKDAISMNEFVHQIEVSLKNLITTKDKGLAIGLSEIINENINKLSIYERPIHCTDKKRETLYIKNDTWEKDKDKEKTKSMLKSIQSQQFKSMQKWIKEHPNYMNDDNLKHEYMILVNKCSSSLNDHEKKVVKNICDNIYVNDDNILID